MSRGQELFMHKTAHGGSANFHAGDALRAAVLSRPRPLDGYLLASSASAASAAAQAVGVFVGWLVGGKKGWVGRGCAF
jgi:hypothetical protein